MLRLYDYFRSSAAYRVRIAINLKGVEAAQVEVHLTKDGGAQHTPDYRKINPQALVPALAVDGDVLTQSLAIIEYLDEQYPQPPFLPRDAKERAHVRAMALSIAAEVHPIQNLRVLEYLRHQLHQPEEAVQAWARHWIETGLVAMEGLVARAPAGRYCYGDQVTMADIMLAPQMANARRFKCNLALFPHLVEIDSTLCAMPAFHKAAPENHPQAPKA